MADARGELRLAGPVKRPARVAVVGWVAACLTLLAVIWVPLEARADVVDPTDDGYQVAVRIHFYGNGVPGGEATHDVTVSPSCWWAPAADDYTDAVAMLAWYDEVTGGLQTDGVQGTYGPRQPWQDAADAAKAGTKLWWYKAYCKDPNDYTKFGINGTEVSDPVAGGPLTYVTFLYRTFPGGEAPPAPRVPPEELAKAAYAEMHIPEPVTERNPKITGTPGAPTLVGLPTWFWVTDPLALGDAKNELRVTAEINQPDGLVYATVTATGDGLKISSDYGGTQCGRGPALVSYPPASSAAKPCTVAFSHASKSLAVTMSTKWEATWQGSGGTGGTLPGLNQQATEQVAVAEVQNVVTR